MQALARRLATAPRRHWPAQPVSVTLVITDLDVGGAERALVALATGLDRRRWRASVVCLGPEGELAGPLRSAGIEVDCLGVKRRNPLGAVARLGRVLRQFRPELVQSFLFHANASARLAAPLAGRPWVIGGIRVAEREKDWHLLIDGLTTRLSAGSVCVSEGVRRFTRDVGRIDPERLVVIPNGVDPRPFDEAKPADRAALGIPDNVPLALYVGRLELQKGLTFLLDAVARVDSLHLCIAGDGPYRDVLIEQARELPTLGSRVHWLGRRGDVPSLLKAADFLVLPSLWEGMPNVVLEAMAARRAVVATSVEGTEDLVVPSETGWLVPPSDVDALAAALREATADHDRLNKLGEAGRLRIETYFTPPRVVTAYEHLWAGVLGLDYGRDSSKKSSTDDTEGHR
jgi:glycosyltransferase involved in cell wall biosynthesis